MWAAFDERGSAAVVEELLRLGADPAATNQAGETALDWALRRGDTAAVAALRKAGISETASMKASIEKSLALLQTSSAQFNKVAGCSSCHHQLLPQMALGVARTRGLKVDDPEAQHQLDVTVGILKRVYEQARANRDRIPDPPISVSYTLLALAAENYKPDDITDAMVHVIAAWQSDDGAFHPLPSMRPPMESNSITATALSLRAIQLYGTGRDEMIARASRWLRTATPRTTEERAMQVLGLALAKAPADDIRRSAKALLAEQRQDGGWGQLPTLETDAYATGQALVALQAAGHSVTGASIGAASTSCCARSSRTARGWCARARIRCSRCATAASRTARTSGSPRQERAGRRWRFRWRCRRNLRRQRPIHNRTAARRAPDGDRGHSVHEGNLSEPPRRSMYRAAALRGH